jgi:hypothetical protein
LWSSSRRFFGRLFAGVFVGFPLLRNKANFGFLLVGPKL